MWGRIVNSVSSALDINLATLSGCIDVLAVPQEDGTLRSSPFHVRFGKAKLLRSREKVVTITVNGKLVDDVTLTLGAAGEAFFMEEVGDGEDDDTSPLGEDDDAPTSPQAELAGTGANNATGTDTRRVDTARSAVPVHTRGGRRSEAAPDMLDESGASRVQFSLCGDLLFGTLDEVPHDEAVFRSNVVSWDALEADPSIWFNPALVARFDGGGPVYPSKVALPLICSWVAFKRPLSLTAVQKLMTSSLSSAAIEDPSFLNWVYNGAHQTGSATLQPVDPDRQVEAPTPQHEHVGKEYGRPAGDDQVRERVPNMNHTPELHHPEAPLHNVILTPPHDPTSTDNTGTNNTGTDNTGTDRVPVNDNSEKINIPVLSAPLSDRSTQSVTGVGINGNRIIPQKVRPRTSSMAGDAAVDVAVVHSPGAHDGLRDGGWAEGVPMSGGLPEWMQSSPFCMCYHPGYSPVRDESALKGGQSKRYRRTLRPTSDQLAKMQLVEGVNSVVFSVSSPLQGTKTVQGSVYLWRRDAKIIVSDVDGTITRSDVLGQLMPIVGRDWSHLGVADLFSKIRNNGYQILYLTARAIGQADSTRDYLFGLRQNDEEQLPDGPLILSPDRLFNSFKREVIDRKPYVFKIAALRDIRSLFPPHGNPFVAGFGNREADHRAYVCNGIPEGKVFIIDKNGVVHHINRAYAKTYESMSAICAAMFPPLSIELGPNVFKCTDEQVRLLKRLVPELKYQSYSQYYLSKLQNDLMARQPQQRPGGRLRAMCCYPSMDAPLLGDTDDFPEPE